jgi:17beta-estradiol 17-dehydrogenase / very-long-chain 3-oxoacyl-CoA reductase
MAVNNVGKSHDFPTPFVEENVQTLEDIVEINVMSVVKTTRIFLPNMISRY